MAAKQPAFMFYVGDWLKDASLGLCSPGTRGIWMDLLCCMHDLDRCGRLTGTLEQLSRLCRATPAQVGQAIDELTTSNACDVTIRDGRVTLTNRRMRREWEARKAAAERKKRQRDKEGNACPGDVTQKSRAYSSSAIADSSSDGTSPGPQKPEGRRRNARLVDTTAAVTGLPASNRRGQPVSVPRQIQAAAPSPDISDAVLAAATRCVNAEAQRHGRPPPPNGLNALQLSDLARLVTEWGDAAVIRGIEAGIAGDKSWGRIKAAIGAGERNAEWAAADAKRARPNRRGITPEIQAAIDDVFDE